MWSIREEVLGIVDLTCVGRRAPGQTVVGIVGSVL